MFLQIDRIPNSDKKSRSGIDDLLVMEENMEKEKALHVDDQNNNFLFEVNGKIMTRKS